ncbi:MAG: DUF917 domain-containing protein [Candidatus Aenigmatarchaeota archaeon]
MIDKNTLRAIATGSSILATGGGGSIKAATNIIEKMDCDKCNMIKLDDMDQSEYIFTVFAVGSVNNEDNIDSYLENIIKAKNKLETLLNIKFSAIIPVEIGPCSLVETFYLASLMKLAVVDADIVGGRCSPEIFIETLSLKNIDRSPVVIVGKNCIIDIIFEKDVYKLEKNIRDISDKFGDYVYVVGYPMKIGDVKDILTKDTVSLSMKLGNITNLSKILELLSAREIFCGKIQNVDKNNANGFLQGTVFVAGSGMYENKSAEIFFKNENLIAWIDKCVTATCPDSISVIDSNLNGVYNRDITDGMEVSIIAIPAIGLWKTENGLKIFNPRKFGFNIDYIPINI